MRRQRRQPPPPSSPSALPPKQYDTQCYGARLVEGDVEGVLIVDDGGDEGEDEAAGAAALRVPGAVVHVLVQQACCLY